MNKQLPLDEWVIILIKDKMSLLGRDAGTRKYRLTSAIHEMDYSHPPQWAITKSGSHYKLLKRSGVISKEAHAVALDTLVHWGFSTEDASCCLERAAEEIHERNAEEFRKRNALSAPS